MFLPWCLKVCYHPTYKHSLNETEWWNTTINGEKSTWFQYLMAKLLGKDKEPQFFDSTMICGGSPKSICFDAQLPSLRFFLPDCRGSVQLSKIHISKCRRAKVLWLQLSHIVISFNCYYRRCHTGVSHDNIFTQGFLNKLYLSLQLNLVLRSHSK